MYFKAASELYEMCKEKKAVTLEGNPIELSQSELQRIEHLLKSFPLDDISIVGAEATAIYYEAIGNYSEALRARQCHVERLNWLHKDLQDHPHDKETMEVLLDGRDEDAIQHSVLAIRRLEGLLSNRSRVE